MKKPHCRFYLNMGNPHDPLQIDHPQIVFVHPSDKLIFFHSQALSVRGVRARGTKPTENHQNNSIRLPRDLITGLERDAKH